MHVGAEILSHSLVDFGRVVGQVPATPADFVLEAAALIVYVHTSPIRVGHARTNPPTAGTNRQG